MSTASRSITSCAMAPPIGGKHSVCAQDHARNAQDHAADGALEGDFAHPSAYVHELIHFFERAFENDGVGGFGSDVGILAEGDADRGGLHGGSVVDAIADKDGFGEICFCLDKGDFFFWAFGGVGDADADFGGEGTDFGFAVAGDQNNFCHVMMGRKVGDENAAVGAGRIFEGEEGGESAVEKD